MDAGHDPTSLMPATVASSARACRRIGFLGFDQCNAFDMVGPMESFVAAQGNGDPRYELCVIGLTRQPFRSESGLCITPDHAIDESPPLDTLVLPGCAGLRMGAGGPQLTAWLQARARDTRRLATVCTGVYALAQAGLLAGRRVSTHWRFADDLQRRHPELTVDADALFVRDGPYYTSAGISAGVDLALALIEEDHGAAVALAAARELVVHLKRDGGQQQYSEPLRFQQRACGPLAELATWMLENLHRDLTVEELADRANLGVRQFNRRFKAAFGCPPSQYLAELRLDEARQRLLLPRASVERTADALGFGSLRAFHRAFSARYGISPGAYRGRFRGTLVS